MQWFNYRLKSIFRVCVCRIANHVFCVFSRAVPKKSATAKPIVSKSSVASKKASQISDKDSDSDFGDFSLPKLTAKAKQVRMYQYDTKW